jgi:hypothetical protein
MGKTCSRGNEYTCNNRRIVGRVVFYAVRVVLKETRQLLPWATSNAVSLLSRVEAGSNTSTVALRVGGDRKRSLESETVKYGHEPHGTRTLKMTALAKTSSKSKRQTRPLVRESAPHQQIRNCLTVKKNLVVSPRWVLYSKTDWPTDRRS